MAWHVSRVSVFSPFGAVGAVGATVGRPIFRYRLFRLYWLSDSVTDCDLLFSLTKIN